jgi:hypothetical protein
VRLLAAPSGMFILVICERVYPIAGHLSRARYTTISGIGNRVTPVMDPRSAGRATLIGRPSERGRYISRTSRRHHGRRARPSPRVARPSSRCRRSFARCSSGLSRDERGPWAGADGRAEGGAGSSERLPLSLGKPAGRPALDLLRGGSSGAPSRRRPSIAGRQLSTVIN